MVGAGAMGMAFTDALLDHSDARVVLVDRREGVGGHWRKAYPFVRLHQSSTFYGVASRVLGGGRIQQSGPEAGLHERADQPTICAYYEDLMADKMLGVRPGPVLPRLRVPRGTRLRLARHGRAVRGATGLPDRRRPLPRSRHPGGDTAEVHGVRGCASHPGQRPGGGCEDPSQYVIVGSGKTATDACVFLLTQRGVDPDAICWVRPRDPWMLNRALIQPDPVDLPRHGCRHDARGGGVDIAGRGVPPAGGGRHHAAHRPRDHADDGQGTHPRDLGARPPAQHRERGTPRPRRYRATRQDRPDAGVDLGRGRRPGRELRGGRAEEPTAGAHLGTGRHHPAADQGRFPLLRGGTRRVRRGDPRRATTSRTGSARPRRSATHSRSGRP